MLLYRKRRRFSSAGRRECFSMPVTGKNWVQQVRETSDALDLEEGVFTWDDPARIARSLAKSALASTRRKAPPFRSAMAMLNYYCNRAGRTLSPARRRILAQAKDELRCLFGREPRGSCTLKPRYARFDPLPRAHKRAARTGTQRRAGRAADGSETR